MNYEAMGQSQPSLMIPDLIDDPYGGYAPTVEELQEEKLEEELRVNPSLYLDYRATVAPIENEIVQLTNELNAIEQREGAGSALHTAYQSVLSSLTGKTGGKTPVATTSGIQPATLAIVGGGALALIALIALNR